MLLASHSCWHWGVSAGGWLAAAQLCPPPPCLWVRDPPGAPLSGHTQRADRENGPLKTHTVPTHLEICKTLKDLGHTGPALMFPALSSAYDVLTKGRQCQAGGGGPASTPKRFPSQPTQRTWGISLPTGNTKTEAHTTLTPWTQTPQQRSDFHSSSPERPHRSHKALASASGPRDKISDDWWTVPLKRKGWK